MLVLWENHSLIITALTVFPPFFAFVLIALGVRRHPKAAAAASVTAVGISLAGTSILLASNFSAAHAVQFTVPWLDAPDVLLRFGFLLDGTSLLMLAVVAAIAFLVQVYSLGYMKGDPGFGRYYAFQSLFAWAMMSLALSTSLLQLYVFWELVGLSSYLLIGFWYERFSATQAGKKAFVMTRLGDVALFLGLLLILNHYGNLNILELNASETAGRMSHGMMTLCAFLIFGGIVGKSAQFPLMTWLPDAMEGPTPVSALLHSATMVAAGVFLFARLFPFFSHSPEAMTVFLAIGTLSMIMSSTMALVDRDIKKVWAYSTISQFGFMIMALGGGGYFAGAFHLTTHAGFKALLFLCAGVWIHYFKTNDIFQIAKLGGRRMKIPMLCTVVAAASLSGLPPFSGFFSKEAIMRVLAGLENPIWVVAGLIGVFLTAYYAFRPVFIILFPKEDGRKEAGSCEGPEPCGGFPYWVMAWPLVVLAGIVLILGFFEDALRLFLLHQATNGETSSWISYASVGIAFTALAVAWFEFGRHGAAQVGFAERVAWIRKLFGQRWYLDHFYRRFLDLVIYRTFANLCNRNDRQVIDGAIKALCQFTVGRGRQLSRVQSGILRYNILVAVAILGCTALWFFLS